jgi:CelD/BcsL family acetyltransferase involved in cellulose biosynthesis
MTNAAADTKLDITVLEDFEDPALEWHRWDDLLVSSTDVVFLTLDWQRQWWRAFGGERLLLVVAERHGEPVAIAPLFVSGEMLFLVGSGGSDYLDFIGAPEEDVLAAMLDIARNRISGFAGIGLYHVPLGSGTTALLPGVAARLGLELHREGGMTGPYADLTDAAMVQRLTGRRSVRKEETRMRRAGPLRTRVAASDELDRWLELFFVQHASRWGAVGETGLEREDARAFCRAIVHAGHWAGWLRFTMLEWRDAPVAFDISLLHGARQLCYLVARDPAIRAYSPGRVLQAHVVTDALARGVRRFDFGLGDEDYKLRVASGVTEVANWFLYPP